MKPPAIFLFYTVVLLFLGGIAYLFPDEGIQFNEEYGLNFPSIEDFLELDTVPEKNVEDIFEQMEEGKNEGIQIAGDSTISEEEFIAYLEDSIYKTRLRIQYPDGDKSILYPLFAELENAWGYDRPVRIMHYGDSQLEGDRISSFFRARLQEKFGGSGPGLIPAYQTVPSFSVYQDNSDNWQRFSSFGVRGGSHGHRRFGILANYTRFAPTLAEAPDPQSDYEAWIRIHQSKVAYSKSRTYKKIKLFYGHNERPVVTKRLADGQFLGIDSLKESNNLKVKTWTFDKTPKELTIFFSGKDSPEIYGLSLESEHGVVVDNIALRGSAGTIFTTIDNGLLKSSYDKLNVKAFFLQFGGNAVPHLDSLAEVVEYGKSFKRQIKFFQRLVPDATIVVIGPADMSVKDKTEFVTAPFVEEVRDELRKAAFETGAAFYDIYEVMGGRNSMPAWVDASPSLAGPDYIHFTPRGAKKIAEMFYDNLMEDYEEYKKVTQTASKR